MRIVLFIVTLMVFFAFRSEAQGQGATGVGASIEVVPISHRTISFRGGVFSAKFLCGTILPDPLNFQLPVGGAPGVPGTYITAINIYNPNNFTVRFAKKAIETIPQNIRNIRGAVGRQVIETLGPMQGLEVDCQNIWELFNFGAFEPGGQLRKGFVDIAINPFVHLEVVGVYTLKNVVCAFPGPGCPPPPTPPT